MKPPTLLWKVHISYVKRFTPVATAAVGKVFHWSTFIFVVCSMVGAMSMNDLYRGRESMNHSLSQIPHWFWRLTLHQSQTQTQVCFKKTERQKRKGKNLRCSRARHRQECASKRQNGKKTKSQKDWCCIGARLRQECVSKWDLAPLPRPPNWCRLRFMLTLSPQNWKRDQQKSTKKLLTNIGLFVGTSWTPAHMGQLKFMSII